MLFKIGESVPATPPPTVLTTLSMRLVALSVISCVQPVGAAACAKGILVPDGIKAASAVCTIRNSSYLTESPDVVPAVSPVNLKLPIGKLVVGGDWPLRVTALDKPLAKSLLVLLLIVDDIVVPVTTGLPAGRVKVPDPLYGTLHPHHKGI